MICDVYKLADGTAFIGCRGGKRPDCRICRRPRAELLCDGKKPSKKSGTCDAPLCPGCTIKRDGKDLCPDCAQGESMPEEKRDCRKPGECRTCKAPVIWAINPETQKRQPIDAEPVDDGEIILTYKPRLNELWLAMAAKVDAYVLQGRRRYRSHFATCPDSREHRRAP